MSNVQPITPYQPKLNVKIANEFCSEVPENVTNTSLVNTVPVIPVSNNNSAKQLSDTTIAALISQQAVHNNRLTDSEKKQRGVFETDTGITLLQLSKVDAVLKPGVYEHVKKLLEKNPGLPLEKVLPPTLFTGIKGIKSIVSVLQNKKLQVATISESLQKSTTKLSNQGILKGVESDTDISGVIFASSLEGVDKVAETLGNIANIPSTINSNTDIGKLIASGNFAANLADKMNAGYSGIAAQISEVNNQLSPTNLSTSSTSTVSSSIYNNTSEDNNVSSSSLIEDANNKRTSYNSLVEEKQNSEDLLNQAKREYKNDSSIANLNSLRIAEQKFAESSKKLEKLKAELGIQSTYDDSMIEAITYPKTDKVLQNIVDTLSSNIKTKYSRLADWYVESVKELGSYPGMKTMIASLASLGGMSNKTRIANVASDVKLDDNVVIASVLNKTLDSKVPAPIFGKEYDGRKDSTQAGKHREMLDQIQLLIKTRTEVSDRFDKLSTQFSQTRDGGLLSQLKELTDEIEDLDSQISSARKKYYASIA
jgi:hypothetical protein